MKRLMMIGAGFLQTFVIKKAKELGYYVIAVDGNPKAEGFAYADESAIINIIDENACLSFAKKMRIDGVMTAATDFGVLSTALIANELRLPGIKYESAKRIKNKYMVRKCLFDNNVDDTEQAYEVTEKTDIVSLGAKLTYPVMVKPCDGSGSRGASKVEKYHELADACNFAILNSVSHRAEIESFIDGREYGVESLVVGGEIHVLAVMKKWMTQPPYYAELGHSIPSGLDEHVEEKIKICAKRAIEVLDINFGAVNMDILVTEKENVHIVDIGARMGGNLIGSHIVKLGTGIDYLGNLIKATMGDSVDFTVSNPTNVVTRLLALTTGKIMSIPDMDAITDKNHVEILHHLHVDDEIREYHTNLDGCGYVISSSSVYDEALDNAMNALNEVDKSIKRNA